MEKCTIYLFLNLNLLHHLLLNLCILMYGVLLLSHLSMVFIIMLSLLIILQGLLGYIFLNPNLKCFPSLFCSRPWLKHSSLPKLKPLDLMEVGSILLLPLSHICPNMALSIRFLAHIHPKKMDLLKGNIGTSLKAQSPFYLKLLCPLPFGPMLFLLHFF